MQLSFTPLNHFYGSDDPTKYSVPTIRCETVGTIRAPRFSGRRSHAEKPDAHQRENHSRHGPDDIRRVHILCRIHDDRLQGRTGRMSRRQCRNCVVLEIPADPVKHSQPFPRRLLALGVVASISAVYVPVLLADGEAAPAVPPTGGAMQLGRKLLSTGDVRVRFSAAPKIRTDADGVEKTTFCIENPSPEAKAVAVFAGSLWQDLGTLAAGETRCSAIEGRGYGASLQLQEHAPW